MKLTSVRFTATWIDDEGLLQRGLSHFKLGLGPCGKVVQSLRATITPTRMIVTQKHSDGSAKRFTYQLRDITGRIEEEYDDGEAPARTEVR